MDKLIVKDTTINFKKVGNEDYFLLTDLAKLKNSNAPADVVKNWMRSRMTIQFLDLWEKINNPGSKLVEIDQFEKEAGGIIV